MNKEPLTERQFFRVGILENLVLPIVLIPYVTANTDTGWHWLVFFLGLIAFGFYGYILFFYGKKKRQFMEYMENGFTKFSYVLKSFYALRFSLKAGLILIYFSTAITTFLLPNTNVWLIIVIFASVCGMSLNGETEKRGRLLELLFLWLILPLILFAVFSISGIDVGGMTVNTPANTSHSAFKIIRGSAFVVLTFTTCELLTFYYPRIKEHAGIITVKIYTWIIISVVMSYLLVMGILGPGWVATNPFASFFVMESGTGRTGAINRMDYLILSFFIIGLFAVISGYLYRSKSLIFNMFSKSRPTKDKKALPKSAKDNTERICIIISTLLVILFALLWSEETIARVLLFYLVCIDIPVSLVVPISITNCSRLEFPKKVKSILTIVFFIGISLTLGGCTKKKDNLSIENKDYVITLEISPAENDAYTFSFHTINLSEYKGEQPSLKEDAAYETTTDSINLALNEYALENERNLDLAHMKSIKIHANHASLMENENLSKLILEFEYMIDVQKSIEVKLVDKETTLKELIKNIYNRQYSI